MDSEMRRHLKSILVLSLVGLIFMKVIIMAQQDWLQGWRDATIAIGDVKKANIIDPLSGKKRLDKNGQELFVDYFRVIGTGIICANPNEAEKIPYLLTAKHIFNDPSRNWHPESIRIRFSWFDKYSVTQNLGVEIEIRDKQNNPLWIEHDDKRVDLAVIKLTISRQNAQRDSVNPVKITDIAQESEIFEGANILIFGYPGAVGHDYWTHAIVRSGIISWISNEKNSYIPLLVDAMVFPGNSGGPVFRLPSGMDKTGNFAIGGRAAFIGIVSAVKKQPTKLETANIAVDILISGKDDKSIESFDYMGLAVVVPAEKVKELLNKIAPI